MKAHSRSPFLLVPAAFAVAALSACGSGGGGGGGNTPTTQVSGEVVKGPVSGAQVCAFRLSNGAKGDEIKCVTTGAGGTYSMDLQYEGDVLIEATGGTYLDEATNTTQTLSEPMRVVLHAEGGTATGMVTPLTTVAYSIAAAGQGGVSAASFGSAASSVASQFQLNNVNIVVNAPVVAGTTNAYGQALRAVSQFIANGNSLAAFQAYANPSSFQAAFSSAYATINGTTITFSFGTGSGGGTGGTGGSTGGSGGESCGITVSGTGTVATNGMNVPFTLPSTKVCVTGLPAGACAAGNSQLQGIAAAGAAPSGGNYSINYSYSYAANDCSNAIATVGYTQ